MSSEAHQIDRVCQLISGLSIKEFRLLDAKSRRRYRAWSRRAVRPWIILTGEKKLSQESLDQILREYEEDGNKIGEAPGELFVR